MQSECPIHWGPSQESEAILRKLYRNRAKKPIIVGVILSYVGLVFIPAEGESAFVEAAIPAHVLILLFWAAAYWYFGSKKFAPSRCSYIPSPTAILVVDGWTTDSMDFQIVKDCTSDVVVRFEWYVLGYISIPKEVVEIIKHRSDSKE